MSQIFKGVASTPSVATTYTTDSGSAVPVANNLNIIGDQTVVNDNQGIVTSASGSTVSVKLTNRQTGQINTSDDTPTPILSFMFGSSGDVTTFEGTVTAIRADNGHGASWRVFSSFRSDGASTTEIGEDVSLNFNDIDLSTASVGFSAIGNAAVLQVIGIVGVSMRWDAMITYRMVI